MQDTQPGLYHHLADPVRCNLHTRSWPRLLLERVHLLTHPGINLGLRYKVLWLLKLRRLKGQKSCRACIHALPDYNLFMAFLCGSPQCFSAHMPHNS
eukprot:scaffold166733_cov16-Tisochrysis_lutea.AAC.2